MAKKGVYMKRQTKMDFLVNHLNLKIMVNSLKYKLGHSYLIEAKLRSKTPKVGFKWNVESQVECEVLQEEIIVPHGKGESLKPSVTVEASREAGLPALKPTSPGGQLGLVSCPTLHPGKSHNQRSIRHTSCKFQSPFLVFPRSHIS